MEKVYRIYKLYFENDEKSVYIGATIERLSQRRVRHCMEMKDLTKKNKKVIWMRELVSKGYRPKIILIEETTVDYWEERERFWIYKFKEMGYVLTNSTIGGSGCNGHKFSRESIERLSKSRTGVKPKPYIRDQTNTFTLEANKKRSDTMCKLKSQGKIKPSSASKGITRDIQQFTKSGILIAEYFGTNQAAKMNGIKSNAITENLRGKSKSSGGYVWKYKFPK